MELLKRTELNPDLRIFSTPREDDSDDEFERRTVGPTPWQVPVAKWSQFNQSVIEAPTNG